MAQAEGEQSATVGDEHISEEEEVRVCVRVCVCVCVWEGGL